MNEMHAIYKIPLPYDGPPSRRCMICDKPKDPKATLFYDVGWLCEDCRQKLRKLMEVTDEY